MKKTLLVLLVLFIILHNGFSQNILIDTVNFVTGKQRIETFNYLDSTIDISYYDSLGYIEIEQHFKMVDSIKCISCTDIRSKDTSSVRYIFRTNFNFDDRSIQTVIQVGNWNYYENGKIVKTINYLPLAYEYEWVHCDYKYDKNGRCLPCSGADSVDFLIDKIIYYDHNQNVVKVENFETKKS